MKTKSRHVITLEEFKEIHYGKWGKKKETPLEADYETFKTFHAKALRISGKGAKKKPIPLK